MGRMFHQVYFLFSEMCSCSLKILSSNWISVFIDSNLTAGANPAVFLVEKMNSEFNLSSIFVQILISEMSR
jgi:hypothetical protein